MGKRQSVGEVLCIIRVDRVTKGGKNKGEGLCVVSSTKTEGGEVEKEVKSASEKGILQEVRTRKKNRQKDGGAPGLKERKP